jgi:GntR family transcriptional regulator
VPRYVWLATQLRQLAKEAGEYNSLPSERTIARSYGVSRDTVRKAVRVMEEQGQVYSDRGRGTYAAPDAVRRMSGLLYSFSQDAKLHGGTPGQRILYLGKTAAPPAAAEALGIAADATVTRIHRVRLIDAVPVGIHDAFLNLPSEIDVVPADLEKEASIYALLTRAGISLVEALDVLCASAATEEDAAELNLAVGVPLLVSKRTAFSDRRRPIEYCEMRYKTGYKYRNRVSYLNKLT